MKRRAIDKQKNYMVGINTWLFGVGTILVSYNWYISLSSKSGDSATALSRFSFNEIMFVSTIAIMLGGLFYSLVILRPDLAKRNREKELLQLTLEATHHDDYTDVKTGLYNHLFFEKTLKSYLEEFNLGGEKLGLFYIDVSNKNGLDDAVFKEIGSVLENTARDYDIVSRVDGNRFAVITPHIKTEDLAAISGRFKMMIERSENIPADNKFSIGSASNEKKSTTSSDIIQNARHNLEIAIRLNQGSK